MIIRLTNCQIRSMITGCEGTAAKHRANGKFKLAFAAQSRACLYRAELLAREQGKPVPPQEVRHGAS